MAKWADVSINDLLDRYNTALTAYNTAQSFGNTGLQQQISALQSTINNLPPGSTYLRWLFGKKLTDLQNQLGAQGVEARNAAAQAAATRRATEPVYGEPEGYYTTGAVREPTADESAELARIREEIARLEAMGAGGRGKDTQPAWFNNLGQGTSSLGLPPSHPLSVGATDVSGILDQLKAREQAILAGLRGESTYTPYEPQFTTNDIAQGYYTPSEFTPRAYAPTPKPASWLDKYLVEQGIRPLGAQAEITPDQMAGMMDYEAWQRAGRPEQLGEDYLSTLSRMPSWMEQRVRRDVSLFPQSVAMPTRRLARWQR
jgi:hypothetical protein